MVDWRLSWSSEMGRSHSPWHLHLHVHVVVYENYTWIARMKGKKSVGVIKPSSFNQLTHDIDRHLTQQPKTTVLIDDFVPEKKRAILQAYRSGYDPLASYIKNFQKKWKNFEKKRKKIFGRRSGWRQTLIDLDDFMNDFYEQSRRKQQRKEDGKHKLSVCWQGPRNMIYYVQIALEQTSVIVRFCIFDIMVVWKK